MRCPPYGSKLLLSHRCKGASDVPTEKKNGEPGSWSRTTFDARYFGAELLRWSRRSKLRRSKLRRSKLRRSKLVRSTTYRRIRKSTKGNPSLSGTTSPRSSDRRCPSTSTQDGQEAAPKTATPGT